MKLKTSIQISITGEQKERFLNMCAHHSIHLYNIKKYDNYYCASIHPACFFSLKSIIKKSDVKIKIMSKNGPYFLFQSIKKESIFILFPILCVFIIWMSSHYLWNIQLTGNISLTGDIIRDYLYDNGIYYGMPLKEIPINELKFNIRNEYPQINWVSIYLEGTTLQIALKENDNEIYESKTQDIREDLIAPCDGIVENILVRNGTANVKPGNEVSKGQILILGEFQIPAEDGSIKETQYCSADGDITIISNYSISETLSLTHTSKDYTGHQTKKLEVIYKDTSYMFPTSKISYLNYEIMTEVKENALLSIFSIPIKIYQKTYYEYFEKEEKYTAEESQKLLNKKLDEICETFIEKGVQIIEKNVKIETNSVYSTMSGSLTLRVPCNRNNLLEDNS